MKAKRGEKRHWGREGGTERKDAKWKVGQGDRVGEKRKTGGGERSMMGTGREWLASEPSLLALSMLSRSCFFTVRCIKIAPIGTPIVSVVHSHHAGCCVIH